MSPFYSEAKISKKIRYFGIVSSLTTLAAGIFWGRADLIGAVGAVGLAALVPYVYYEKKNIEIKRSAMRAFYGDAYHQVQRMTRAEYEQLSEEEQHAYDETGGDIGVREIEFDEDVQSVEKKELFLAVFLTLLWAFGAVIYDVISLSLCSVGAAECSS